MTPARDEVPGLERKRLDPKRARRFMWVGLIAAFLILPLFSAPGHYIPDTRDALWFDPATYIRHSFTLWQSSPNLGAEQHDAIIIPMGILVTVLRGIGLPIWVAERLWHGLLLLVAASGTILLIDVLRGRTTVAAPLVGGLLYALTPYAFSYGLAITGAFLPYVLLPLLMAVTVRWVGRRGLIGPVLFGLTTFLMGGGNGAPQVYAVVPSVALAIWLIVVEHNVAWRQVARFFAWSLLFFLGLNAYWLFAFAGSNVSNILAFSEQPKVINVTSSFSESVRGLGFWVYYGGDQFGPWTPAVQRFVSSPLLVLTGFAVPVGALVSAWLVRWRFRLFLLFLMIGAVMVMAGTFPVTTPTPFGHLLLFAYDHMPGLRGLRTTYKFAGSLAISVAVLVGVGAEAAWEWARTLTSRRPAGMTARWLVAGVTVVVVAASTSALWEGKLYAPIGTATGLPAYWTQALDWLGNRDRTTRAFFAPSSTAPIYRWGRLHEGLADATPSLSSAHANRVPLGEHYGSNLMAAIEQPYQRDLSFQDVAAMLRYLGVRDVVLQNDLDWRRGHTARPAETQALANDPGLESAITFGAAGRNVVDPKAPAGLGGKSASVEKGLPPVQILSVPAPLGVVQTSGETPIVVSGDGFGIADMANRGLLGSNPPLLYSGSLIGDQLVALARQGASFVITDTNRRRAWSFSGVRRNYSYTMATGETLPGASVSNIAYGLFGGRLDTQTVGVDEGARSITASAYGSPFEAAPEFRPVNAFDDNPNTWWLVGILGNPLGAWIQETFSHPTSVAEARLTLPPLGFARQISLARLEFSDGSSILAALHSGTNVVQFPDRVSSFLRIRIMSLTDVASLNGVGFSDVQIPGVSVREAIQTPSDLIDSLHASSTGEAILASVPLTYLFDRARTDAPFSRDEEPGIIRRFEVPVDRPFSLSGNVHLSTTTPDSEIDRLVRGPSTIEASSSSRLLNAFGLRASSAIDGTAGTAWIPSGKVGEWIKVQFPEHVIDHLDIQTQLVIGRTPITELKVTLSDGSSFTRSVGEHGLVHVHFSPRPVSSVLVTVTKVALASSGRTPPIGISELGIPGVRVRPVSPTVPLPCTTDEMTVDGVPVPVRAQGTAGELLTGQNLPLQTCDGVPIPLSAGWHEVVEVGGLQPDALTLTTADAIPGRSAPVAPRIAVHPTTGGGYDVDIRGATQPFYLSSGQNFSLVWRASIGGHSLGKPLVLDGYAAGWRVAKSGSYTIAIRYPPQRRYDLAMAVSVVALFASMAILVRSRVRRRRKAEE